MAKNTKRAQAVQDVVQAVTDAVAADADTDEDKPPAELGPLFNFGDDSERIHDRTNCYRIEPINEGLLDAIAVDATEEDIRNRWGGGKYKLIAVDSDGRIMMNRTVKIAGDPVFDNDIAQQQYTRLLRQKFGITAAGSNPPAATTDADTQAEERHRRTMERIAAEAEAKAKVDGERRRAEREEREAEERRRAEERKADREREEAHRKQERQEREEREERRWREEREARDREFRERMAADDRRREEERQERDRDRDREERRDQAAHRQDPTAMLVQGMQLAMSMGGGAEPPDAMTAFLTKAPELLAGAKDLLGTPTRTNPPPRPVPANGKKPGPDPIVIAADDPLGKEIYRKAAALGPNGAQSVYQAMRKAVGEIVTPAQPPAAPVAAAKPAIKRPAVRPSAKIGKAKR